MGHGSYELVDNVDYGNHQQALAWLAEHYAGPLNVATGYIGLEGLDALAKIAAEREQPTRLLIGAAPYGKHWLAHRGRVSQTASSNRFRPCAVKGISRPSPPPGEPFLSGSPASSSPTALPCAVTSDASSMAKPMSSVN